MYLSELKVPYLEYSSSVSIKVISMGMKDGSLSNFPTLTYKSMWEV
jgi:hypothetical protein